MATATIESLLRSGTEILKVSSPSPRLDTEILLGFVLQRTKLQLITASAEVVTTTQEEQFNELLRRRSASEPIAYLTGKKEFFGLSFEVSPEVLVPRPETELLVECALKEIEGLPEVTLLDLGTGSGCIAIALAVASRERGQNIRVVATDMSEASLDVARRNAQANGVDGILEFRQGEWFSCFAANEKFDVIVSNPPYIGIGDPSISPELKYEPSRALYAEDGGLRDIETIFRGIAAREKPPRLVLIEIGAQQGDPVRNALSSGLWGDLYRSFAVDILNDLAGLPRLIRARMTP